jgi:putative ABC transport system substrate-binding protein
MRRRDFIKVIAGATAVCPLVVRAQQQVGKIFHIGVLETTSQALNGDNFDAFRQGLHEFEYIEGQNLVIEYRSADGHNERFPNLATELARLNVDLILARGTPAALAAKNATRTIPIVLLGIGDPVEQASWLASRTRAQISQGSVPLPPNYMQNGLSCSQSWYRESHGLRF